MAHILIIIDAIEELQSKSGAPPTQAQSNLMAAFESADAYCHEHEESEESEAILEYIEVVVLPYLQNANPISDPRLVTYTNAIQSMIPG